MNERHQEPPPAPGSAGAPGLRGFLWIALAVVALYSQVIRFDFVTYDDYDLIVQNDAYLSSYSNLATAFTTQVFANRHSESVYYRPLLVASFILEYHIWHLDPVGYHAVNVVLHILTTLFVFLLIEKLTRSSPAALIGGFLFALHPIQTESVAWIAGRNDLLLGLFVVLMMYFYVSSSDRSPRSSRAFALSVLFFALALFTKEAAAFYLLLVPLADICVNRSPVKSLISRRSLMRYGCMAGVLAFYLLVRVGIFGDVVGAERLYGSSPLLRRVLEIPAIVTEYCRLLILPVRLSIAHPLNQLLWLRSPWSWVAGAVSIGLTVLIWYSWRRDRLLCFGLLWFAVGLLPTLDIFPVPIPILEHRIYLPLVGVVLAIVQGGFLVFGPVRGKPAVRYSSAAAILALALLSFFRLPVWQNSETLWLDTIGKAPAYSRSYFNLAGYYFNLQRYGETIGLLKTYVQLKPNDFIGYSKLRQTYYLTGQYTEAVQVCREMIARAPRDPDRYIETAGLFESLKMPDSAMAICRSGLQADSSLYQLHATLGSLYLSRDSLDEAQREFQRALLINPRFAPAMFGMGKCSALRHDVPGAIRSLEEGMQYENPPVEVLQLLATLYVEAGSEEKARELLQRYHF